jgi:hypothetical protein
MRIWIIGAFCFALTALGSYAVNAEQPAPAAAPAVEMEGCPGKADGQPCCTTCQDKREQGLAAAGSEGGCPCQKARKARQAAAAKAKAAQEQ